MFFTYWTQPDVAGEEIPPAVAQMVADWSRVFPAFTVFNDRQVLPLLAKRGHQYVELYEAIRIPACKSDLARLLLLYEHGGMYVDAHVATGDMACLAAVLERLCEVELVLFDQTDVHEHEHDIRIINGALCARRQSAMIDRLLTEALFNLERHYEAERTTGGYVRYNIYALVGADLFLRLFFTSGAPGRRRELLPEFRQTTSVYQLDPQLPVRPYQYYSYRREGEHWSERQKREPLFRMAKPQPASLDELVASARQAAAAGDHAQALAFWRSIVDIDPGHEVGYIGIGETLRDVGRLDEAEHAFAEGVRRFPDSEWLVIGHAGIARDRGDKAEALQRWQLACQKFPDNPAVEVGRGEALANLGEFDRAEALFREVMERFPAYDWAASHYAYMASRRYDWAEAVSRFEKVKARFPDHQFAYFALAEALRASNRTKEAALVSAEQDRRFRKNNIEGASGPRERSPAEQKNPGKPVGASAEIAVVTSAPQSRVSDATSVGPQGERERRAGDGMATVISISGSVDTAQVNRIIEPARRNSEAGQLMQARPHFDKLIAGAADFEARLSAIKSAASVDFRWYPYHTLANFAHIEPLITAEYDPLFQPQKDYADFGCADGDLAYYLESQGNTLHLYDYGPTNMNGLLGARYLHRTLDIVPGDPGRGSSPWTRRVDCRDFFRIQRSHAALLERNSDRRDGARPII